ncbi:hypothetical protein QYB58_002139 [Clostridium perfringens]|nr:hypothetical protein [Clostridium perfringens]
MDKYGFYIKRFIIKGLGKDDVSLNFKEGLNVITGASDTGKTYIFELLNYMMGASNKPKDIIESRGYEEIFLEIGDYENNVFTIKRSLHNENDIILYRCSYELLDNNIPEFLDKKHNKKKNNSISKFLLELSKLKYSKIIVNKSGKSQNFTFRSINNFIMLNEEQIISKSSILEGFEGYAGKTKYKNIFKTIITGIEDICNEDNEIKKISKITIDAKIEMIDELITKYNKDLIELKSKNIEYSHNEIETAITKIKEGINERTNNISDIEDEINTLSKEALEIKEKIEYNSILIKRFKLLKENYLSDLERLDFIDDASFYINQLENKKCPTCDRIIKDTDLIKNEELIIAINSEIRKLNKQIKDLDSVIDNLEIKSEQLNYNYKEIYEKINYLNTRVETEINPIIEINIKYLKDLLDSRSIIYSLDYIKSQLKEIEEERNDLIEHRNNFLDSKANNYEINETNIKDICKEVGNILKGYKLFDTIDVKFDIKSFDLIINGKNKGSFGKGYRSLINSALILAIMNYTTSRELPHPKIVILDSPLTAYRGKDVIEGNDQISDEVKYAFYEYIYEKFKDKQVIILDNAKPKKEIIKDIGYYYFSKNINKGRYGLYPK